MTNLDAKSTRSGNIAGLQSIINTSRGICFSLYGDLEVKGVTKKSDATWSIWMEQFINRQDFNHSFNWSTHLGIVIKPKGLLGVIESTVVTRAL